MAFNIFKESASGRHTLLCRKENRDRLYWGYENDPSALCYKNEMAAKFDADCLNARIART